MKRDEPTAAPAVAPRRPNPRAPASDLLRLLTKVARLYHERGMRQPQIAAQLHISQPRVSRLLKQAADIGIVRTVVVPPGGVYTDLEDAIEHRYGIDDVVVVETDGDEDDDVIAALGGAAAVYLETTLTGGDRVGLSPWGATLLATVEAMRPRPLQVAESVVQILGGVGNAKAQVQATRLTGRLAELTSAVPAFLPAPGLMATNAARAALASDEMVAEVMSAWQRLTMVLVGVGSLEPSPLARDRGNAIAGAEQEALRSLHAVGDICFRFFDENGVAVKSPLDERILGISAEQLRRIPRRVGVAGGRRKYAAIRAALRGGWLSVLITDNGVARRLVEEPVQGVRA
ncbi:sugar-binding transcriptional regulator [Pendulispora rubella]|uniref:Sugar-binding transcriptional regulator n=1 Tax=Pendulispora rubella TaxID=2741070 RepID=A0ABZ2LC38_9BACT